MILRQHLRIFFESALKPNSRTGWGRAGLVILAVAIGAAVAVGQVPGKPKDMVQPAQVDFAASANTPFQGPTGTMLDDLPQTARVRFMAGSAVFHADWVPAPDVSDGADGLGPLYNAVSCGGCHTLEKVVTSYGNVREGKATVPLARVTRFHVPDPVYGRQLQDHAIHGHKPEGRTVVTWHMQQVHLNDGTEVELRQPTTSVSDLGYGVLADKTYVSLRRVPAIEGLGLIAAIAATDIAENADPDDRDNDGISGRAGRSVDPQTGKMELARFGWKAGAVSLAAQTEDAFSLDMGLSSPTAPEKSGDCTREQRACRAAPGGGSPAKAGNEVSEEEIALVVAFLEGLAPPAGQSPNAKSERGFVHFESLGCPACHRPSFETSSRQQMPHLSQKTVRLFSDLLLHDMGHDLADGSAAETGPVGTAPVDATAAATVREWRTAPLWGLGTRLKEIASGRIDGLMHDGRARTIAEAVLWHGGEATAARERYKSLPAAARLELEAFLGNL